MAQTLKALTDLHGWRLVLALTLVAIAARAQTFGNPVIGYDEQFYLVVGERMLGGALPFVDIFDRKPIGLFLIYAAIAALGGEGTIQYQLAAGAFVVATAFLVHRFALRIAPPGGALAAAIAYVLWLDFVEGEGGQAPVFFNLPMIAAALLIAYVWRTRGTDLARMGAAAMLLTGIAMQIKYSALYEGVFFGLALLWVAFERRTRFAAIAGLAVLWAGVALLPTIAAFAVYAALGHGEAFVFANFVSMFGKLPDPFGARVEGVATMAAILFPLLALAHFAPPPRDDDARRDRRFVIAWLIAAISGVLAFGSFLSPQYAMPVLLPACVAAAPAFAKFRRVTPVFLIVALIAGQIVLWALRSNKGGLAHANAVTEAARPRSGGCVFVYDGYPALYRLTGTCLPSRYVFPGHLNTMNEDSAAAIGVNPVAEVERIMAARPETVVDDRPGFEFGNKRTHAVLQRHLARDYTLVARVQTGANRFRFVYRRRGT